MLANTLFSNNVNKLTDNIEEFKLTREDQALYDTYSTILSALAELNIKFSDQLLANEELIKKAKLSDAYQLDVNKLSALESANNFMNQKIVESFPFMEKAQEEIDKIAWGPDTELKSLLSSKMISGYRHAIDCKIEKGSKKMVITIFECDQKGIVDRIFSNLIKADFKSEQKGVDNREEDHSRVIVTIDLKHRDLLIKNLHQIKGIEAIPGAVNNCQRKVEPGK